MEEPPGGYGYGRSSGVALDVATQQIEAERYSEDGEAGSEDGFHLVGPGVPFSDGGTVAHRGVLHSDEYVNPDVLQAAIERRLGFTYAEVSAAYDIAGRPSADKLQLRARLDARLLELSLSGGNLLELAKAFGWSVEPAGDSGGERCKRMERAIARARAAS